MDDDDDADDRDGFISVKVDFLLKVKAMCDHPAYQLPAKEFKRVQCHVTHWVPDTFTFTEMQYQVFVWLNKRAEDHPEGSVMNFSYRQLAIIVNSLGWSDEEQDLLPPVTSWWRRYMTGFHERADWSDDCPCCNNTALSLEKHPKAL